jgi:ketosteroid isomerase-like protein
MAGPTGRQSQAGVFRHYQIRGNKMSISRKILTGSLLISFVILGGACSQQQHAAAPPFSKNTIQEFADLWQQRDDERLSMMFAVDAKLMPPDLPMVEGRAAIRQFLHDMFEQQGLPTELAARDEYTAGDYTFRDGVLTQHLVSGGTQTGKFMQVWKFVDGKWQQYRVIWNVDGKVKP